MFICDLHVEFGEQFKLRKQVMFFFNLDWRRRYNIFFLICQKGLWLASALQACSVNLYSAETGRRLLDTTLIYNMDPNGGKPEKVSLFSFLWFCGCLSYYTNITFRAALQPVVDNGFQSKSFKFCLSALCAGIFEEGRLCRLQGHCADGRPHAHFHTAARYERQITSLLSVLTQVFAEVFVCAAAVLIQYIFPKGKRTGDACIASC